MAAKQLCADGTAAVAGLHIAYIGYSQMAQDRGARSASSLSETSQSCVPGTAPSGREPIKCGRAKARKHGEWERELRPHQCSTPN